MINYFNYIKSIFIVLRSFYVWLYKEASDNDGKSVWKSVGMVCKYILWKEYYVNSEFIINGTENDKFTII